MLKAITRSAQKVDEKVKSHNANLDRGAHPVTVAHFFDHLATPEDTAVMVDEQDFAAAQRELVPSVSSEELSHYERVRQTFEGLDSDKAKKLEAEKKPNMIAAAKQSLPDRLSMTKSPPLQPPPVLRTTASAPKIKRKGSGKGKSESNFYFSSNADDSTDVHGDASTEDDEYLIRTDHLTSHGGAVTNGSDKAKHLSNGNTSNNTHLGNGKGKGKGAGVAHHTSAHGAFGDAAADDEELYE